MLLVYLPVYTASPFRFYYVHMTSVSFLRYLVAKAEMSLARLKELILLKLLVTATITVTVPLVTHCVVVRRVFRQIMRLSSPTGGDSTLLT